MQDYLERLCRVTVESGESKKSLDWTGGASEEKISPEGLCPLFYHNLIPYIMTLRSGGWFRWIKKEKDISKRRSLSEDPFKKDHVNSAFPNEVLVQCPNGKVGIVFGVGKVDNSKNPDITLRFIRRMDEGSCPYGYDESTTFRLKDSDFGMDPLIFNSIFPTLLYGAAKDGGIYELKGPGGTGFTIKNPAAASSTQNRDWPCTPYDDTRASAKKITGPCRYHTDPTENLSAGPRGLCLDALHTIYPYALGLLYDAAFNKNSKEATVRCPVGTNGTGVTFKIEKIKTSSKFSRFFKETARVAYEAVFNPADLIHHKIVYTVDKVEGDCPAGLKVGKKFDFNLDDMAELCPASFHSLYPYIFQKKHGRAFDWDGDAHGAKSSGEAMVPCPDCVGALYTF